MHNDLINLKKYLQYLVKHSSNIIETDNNVFMIEYNPIVNTIIKTISSSFNLHIYRRKVYFTLEEGIVSIYSQDRLDAIRTEDISLLPTDIDGVLIKLEKAIFDFIKNSLKTMIIEDENRRRDKYFNALASCKMKAILNG